jgi:type VI secretion system protein ImpH
VTGPSEPWDEPGEHDFLDLMRRLERRSPIKPRISESGTKSEDIATLGQPPYIDHSDSNVSSIAIQEDGRARVESRFLGLLGPQGALPLHTTYEAAHWNNMRDPAFARFLDIFNNRFQQLFYRAWANARPAVQADRPRDDQFRTYLGAMTGIGTPAMRRRGQLHDFPKFAVAGLLAPAVKSAARLENMLAFLFKAKVNVEQFVGVWLPLEASEQSALSAGSCVLGGDSIIGKSAFSLSDKFRVRLEVPDLQAFETFLPDGQNFESMADAVRYYVGETFVYDVEIGLPTLKTRPLRLGHFGRLGWTSWIKSHETPDHDVVRWDCRFHPSEIEKNSTERASKDKTPWPMSASKP